MTTESCPICEADVPMQLVNDHWAEHMRRGEQPPSPKAEAAGRAIVFWGYCLLVGAAGAAIVSILH